MSRQEDGQGQFMKKRGRLVRVFRLNGFARTRRPRSIPELHALALEDGGDSGRSARRFGYASRRINSSKWRRSSPNSLDLKDCLVLASTSIV